MKKFAEDALNYVNTYSKPSELKITDMRFAHVESSSVHCILPVSYTHLNMIFEVDSVQGEYFQIRIGGRLN